MSESVVVVALGASTPVGRDAWSSAAAVRAGISGFGQHPYMIDTAGEPMRVAMAPWLDIGLSGVERLGALLFPAIDQALEPVVLVTVVFRNTAVAPAGTPLPPVIWKLLSVPLGPIVPPVSLVSRIRPGVIGVKSLPDAVASVK